VALKAHRDGQVLGDERTTVEQFLRAWLRSVEPSVGRRTWIRYEELIRLHAVPHIGKVRLTRLGARQLDQLYGELVRAGLSPTMVMQLHRMLHHALWDAMRWNLVTRNATELVTPPRKARHDFIALSPCIPPTSCSGVSIRCWSGPDCRGFASTTYATVRPRCYLASASTPRS
jgi:hypothetical protein